MEFCETDHLFTVRPGCSEHPSTCLSELWFTATSDSLILAVFLGRANVQSILPLSLHPPSGSILSLQLTWKFDSESKGSPRACQEVKGYQRWTIKKCILYHFSCCQNAQPYMSHTYINCSIFLGPDRGHRNRQEEREKKTTSALMSLKPEPSLHPKGNKAEPTSAPSA